MHRTVRFLHHPFRYSFPGSAAVRIAAAALFLAGLPAGAAGVPESTQPGTDEGPADGAPVVPGESEGSSASETVIEGDQLEMIADEREARFTFTDNIRVTGNNIVLTCDRLEVISSRPVEQRDSGERLAGMGRIRSIVASGRVHVTQEGREATAERAEVLPDEGRVILTGSPVIRDTQGEVSGERIVLYQGLERAVVESSIARPARVTLPTIPDLGFRPGAGEDEPEETDEVPE